MARLRNFTTYYVELIHVASDGILSERLRLWLDINAEDRIGARLMFMPVYKNCNLHDSVRMRMIGFSVD
jgi:hypothetical protein